MQLTFTIQYHTSWGQQVCILGSLPALGNNIPTKALKMNYIENGQWEASIQVRSLASFSYTYVVVDANGHTISEWGNPREIEIPASYKNAIIHLKKHHKTKKRR